MSGTSLTNLIILLFCACLLGSVAAAQLTLGDYSIVGTYTGTVSIGSRAGGTIVINIASSGSASAQMTSLLAISFTGSVSGATVKLAGNGRPLDKDKEDEVMHCDLTGNLAISKVPQISCTFSCYNLQKRSENNVDNPIIFTGVATCSSGTCATPLPKCSSSLTYCNETEKCVNTNYDPSNCGGCGTVCPSKLCSSGKCISLQNQSECIPDLKYQLSDCLNGKQMLTCSDSNNCNTTAGKLVQLLNCTVPAPKCEPDWRCETSPCFEGQQTLTCVDKNNCDTNAGKPPKTQNCISQPASCDPWACTYSPCSKDALRTATCNSPNCLVQTIQERCAYSPSCESSWTCTYGQCSNGQQPIYCNDPTGCNKSASKPSETQSCACAANWDCTQFTDCSADGQQTRSCIDTHACKTVVGKPAEHQSCTPETPSCTEPECLPTECIPDWSCTAFSDCSSAGIKMRICVDTHNCDTTAEKPSETEACTTCAPNWICTYGDCSADGKQTLTCTDTNECNTTTGKPSGTQTCTPSSLQCIPSWDCTDFSICSAGSIQLRTCSDTNSCDTMWGKPKESQNCIPKPIVGPPSSAPKVKEESNLLSILIVGGALAAVLIIAVFFKMRPKTSPPQLPKPPIQQAQVTESKKPQTIAETLKSLEQQPKSPEQQKGLPSVPPKSPR